MKLREIHLFLKYDNDVPRHGEAVYVATLSFDPEIATCGEGRTVDEAVKNMEHAVRTAWNKKQ